MLQVARLAPNLLREATERVDDFLRNQINPDGGFRDRAGRSDLYYTVFGLEGLIALRQEPPYSRVRPFLEGFGEGDGLDLVHLACLARCWAALPSGSLSPQTCRCLAERLESFRAGDGGYAPTPGAPAGTVYHGFLVLGAYQDLGVPIPDATGLATSVQALQLDSGGFSGRPGLPVPSTPNTAAALTLLRQFGSPALPGGSDWLLSQACPDGGFRAAETRPFPTCSRQLPPCMPWPGNRFPSNTTRNQRWIFWTRSGPAGEPSTEIGPTTRPTANTPGTPCSPWAT